MQAWWRVLRGVWPYKFLVIISIICAFGVGLSYAAGVGVMLPVLKIFISAEGVHGWVYRSAVEKRYHVTVWPLETNNTKGKTGLIIDAASKDVAATLQLEGKDYIAVEGVNDGTNNINPETVRVDAKRWLDSAKALALAPDNQDVTLLLRDSHGRQLEQGLRSVTLKSGQNGLASSAMLWAIHFLPQDRMTSLVYTVMFFIFLCIIGSIFRYYQQFIGMAVANRVVMDLRRRMYDRIVQLPTSYFARKGTTDLMSRLTQDTNTLTDGVAMAFGKAIQEPIKAVGAFTLAICLDWKLCLMIVLSMPVLGLIINKFSKHMRKASRRTLESWSSMLGVINESLQGVRVVKAYSAEGYERRRFARVNKKLLKEQKKLVHYGALSRPTIETLAVIASSIPMLIAANWVLQGKSDSQSFFVLLACFAAMLEPMRKLSDVNGKMQHSNAAGARIFEIIDMESEPNHDHSLPKLPRHEKTIEFRDITFSYPGHDEQVLKNIQLTIEHGKNVAVVGGNGSGKTTLLSLLPRLYWPTMGTVLVDGVDISTVSLRSLRSQIGLVTQDTVLFADTIYNNITYGNRHVTREQVLDASRRAYADEFISAMPEGYETMVGEHGVRLSGGQKQRIAIARAILHNPTILILDEAMSQIDSDSEMKISLALREFTKNRTTLMIAHRFQTVISADLIVCLDRGLLVGMGTHTQLLADCPAYRRLYENQFHDGSDTPPEENSNGAAESADAVAPAAAE